VEYRSVVVLQRLPETIVGVPSEAEGGLTLPGDDKTSTKMLARRNTEVTVSVETDRDFILVLNDLYYPYWRVYLDGVSVNCYKPTTLSAGFIKAGAQRVVFRFEPFSWAAVRRVLLQLVGAAPDPGIQ
jgi:hypothetical protein